MGAVWSKPTVFGIKAYGLEFNQAKGLIGGYLTLYNNPETAQPYIDPYRDVVCPGSFTKTIQELQHVKSNRSKEYLLPYLWQHNHSEIIGGVKHLAEDSQGVIFETQLAKGVARAQECFNLHEQGMPMGVSYGYDPIRATPQNGLRLLKEVALREVSSVTFPAHEFAGVTSLKARTFMDIMEDKKEQNLLHDFFGMQDALIASLLEVISDTGVTDTDAQIDTCTTQYSDCVKEWYPEYLAAIAAPEDESPGMGESSPDMVMNMMSANYALFALKNMDIKRGRVLSGKNRTRIVDAIAHIHSRIADLQSLLQETDNTSPIDGKSLRELFILPNTTTQHTQAPAQSTPLSVAPMDNLYSQLVHDMRGYIATSKTE